MHATAWAIALWWLAQTGADPRAAIEEAHRHLAAGKLDEVLFDLDGKAFSGADAHTAAEVLAKAGEKSLEKDPILALQFAQMSLRYERPQALALEVAARAAFSQKQFDPAEHYTDQWLQSSNQAPRARLLRAEIALDEGEWDKALGYVKDLRSGLTTAERDHAKEIRATAERELRERTTGLSTARSLQAQLEAAEERAGKQMALGARGSRSGAEHSRSGVVVYGTSWCGYCAKARSWLQAKGIPFEDKDVEADPSAAEELASKARNAGLRLGGVPVIDVNGTLVNGFDEHRMAQLLR